MLCRRVFSLTSLTSSPLFFAVVFALHFHRFVTNFFRLCEFPHFIYTLSYAWNVHFRDIRLLAFFALFISLFLKHSLFFHFIFAHNRFLPYHFRRTCVRNAFNSMKLEKMTNFSLNTVIQNFFLRTPHLNNYAFSHRFNFILFTASSISWPSRYLNISDLHNHSFIFIFFCPSLFSFFSSSILLYSDFSISQT